MQALASKTTDAADQDPANAANAAQSEYQAMDVHALIDSPRLDDSPTQPYPAYDMHAEALDTHTSTTPSTMTKAQPIADQQSAAALTLRYSTHATIRGVSRCMHSMHPEQHMEMRFKCLQASPTSVLHMV